MQNEEDLYDEAGVILDRPSESNKAAKKGRAKYTEEDHRKGFETWFKTRNIDETARTVLGNHPGAFLTIRNWARPDYHCSWGCPWHGWDLLDERIRENLGDKADNPEARENALVITDDDDFQNNEIITRDDAIANISLTLLERLARWEYIWAKCYYHSSGIVYPMQSIRNPDGSVMNEPELRAQFSKGARPKTLEACIKLLDICQKQINSIRNLIGLDNAKRREIEERNVKKQPPVIETMTLEKARRLKDLVSKLQPLLTKDELELLPELMGFKGALPDLTGS